MLITIAIVLVILAMVVAPVAAALPATSSLPSGKAYETIWSFLQDLQNQIKNIQLTPGPQGPTGPTGPAGNDGAQGPAGTAGSTVATKSGIAEYNEAVDLPAGFSIDKCAVIVGPYDASCDPTSEYKVMAEVKSYYDSNIGPNKIEVATDVRCMSTDGYWRTDSGKSNYLIICHS